MNVSPYSVSVFHDFRTEGDVLAEISRQESRRAQARKNARKQRARELTKARELEIKKAKGDRCAHGTGNGYCTALDKPCDRSCNVYCDEYESTIGENNENKQ